MVHAGPGYGRRAPLYRENCATCHKENAEGTPDWKTRDANGKLPPPPLNGTAHAWHHPLDILRSVVKRGGAPVGGTTPAFGEKLDEAQIDAILAWVQSHWSDEVYKIWHERDLASKVRIAVNALVASDLTTQRVGRRLLCMVPVRLPGAGEHCSRSAPMREDLPCVL